ncbi:phage minor head protein, partial [Bacillus thuringiensis]
KSFNHLYLLLRKKKQSRLKLTLHKLNLIAMWRYPYKGANRNKKTWLTGNDERVCKECGGLHGETVDIDDLFSNGKMCPPAHPHCRCTMVSEE